MKKMFFTYGLMMLFVTYFSMVCTAEEAKKPATPQDLFSSKCTQCHDAQKALKVHQMKTEWMSSIRQMQTRKGANISDKEAEEIATLLGNPNRAVYEQKCSTCHTLDKVDKAHIAGETGKGTIDKMSKKEGANISEKDKKAIDEYLQYRNRPKYPAGIER